MLRNILRDVGKVGNDDDEWLVGVDLVDTVCDIHVMVDKDGVLGLRVNETRKFT